MIIATFVISALGALIVQAPSLDVSVVWDDPYYQHVTKFSFYQAFLSTLLSVGFAGFGWCFWAISDLWQ